VSSDTLAITSSVVGPEARVSLTGELDIHSAPDVTASLADLAQQHVQSVVIDVAGLTFLDSSGLRALLSARNELQTVGAAFSLEGVSGTVERVLDATGLLGLLTGSES
jgi:anti-anti-sigma factor